MLFKPIRCAGLVAILLAAACAPSLYDFHDRVLEPLAIQKADDLAEGTRLRVLKAFEEAKRREQWPGQRWYGLVYWGLDALGFAGYGLPGQGRILEQLREYYQRHSAATREAELREMLRLIDERRGANRTAIQKDLVSHTSEEFALFGRIYSVCVEDVRRRYRAIGNVFRRLEDREC
jgi:hypothetical protein